MDHQGWNLDMEANETVVATEKIANYLKENNIAAIGGLSVDSNGKILIFV